MDFGDTASLRALSGQLSGQGEDTERLHDKISRATAGLAASVSTYELRAARAFHGRWDGVGSVIRRLASDSHRVARGLSTLAGSLDTAEREWVYAASSARGAGFSVTEGTHSATVIAPPDAADGSDAQARAFEHRMNNAAADASRARSALRGLLGEVSGHGLAELQGSRSGSFVNARTGDGGLDGELERVLRPMVAVHENLPKTA